MDKTKHAITIEGGGAVQPKLQTTKNYSRFEMYEFNRDVRKIDNLRRSMKKYGFLPAYPLHCIKDGSNKLKVKAGHHRLTVAKELGLSVAYVVCDDGGVSIHELEKATTPWNMKDYLVSFVRQGKPPYIKVKNYHESTGIPLGLCISLLAGHMAGTGNKTAAFKEGRYEVSTAVNHAAVVADIVLCLKAYGIEWANNSYFVQALSRVVFVSEFDWSKFKKKAKAHKYLFEKQPNLALYVEMIDQIYNRQSRQRIPLVFLADEAAKQRSIIAR